MNAEQTTSERRASALAESGPMLIAGGGAIADLRQPRVEEIDIAAAICWTRNNRRFGNNPQALTIDQHQVLVQELARQDGAAPEVLIWARYHDLHEGVLGVDIPLPLKACLGPELGRIEAGLDDVIADALGIARPTPQLRAAVKTYDRIACWIEQAVCLCREPDGDVPGWALSAWRILVNQPPATSPEVRP